MSGAAERKALQREREREGQAYYGLWFDEISLVEFLTEQGDLDPLKAEDRAEQLAALGRYLSRVTTFPGET